LVLLELFIRGKDCSSVDYYIGNDYFTAKWRLIITLAILHLEYWRGTSSSLYYRVYHPISMEKSAVHQEWQYEFEPAPQFLHYT